MKKPLIIDARFYDIAQKEWGNEFDIIPSCECKNVDSAIAYHPDVSLINICKTVVCAPCVFDYYKKALLPYGVNLVKGERDPKSNYPEDCAYNIAVTQNAVLLKKDVADSKVLEIVRGNNLREIYVNQGYAKCSSVVLPDGIITADSSIYNECQKNAIDCLKIKEGEVKLEPYDYGFLGGASGYSEGTAMFFGDIEKHGDFLKIKEFLKSRKINIKYIKNYPLTDIGTIFFPY